MCGLQALPRRAKRCVQGCSEIQLILDVHLLHTTLQAYCLPCKTSLNASVLSSLTLRITSTAAAALYADDGRNEELEDAAVAGVGERGLMLYSRSVCSGDDNCWRAASPIGRPLRSVSDRSVAACGAPM